MAFDDSRAPGQGEARDDSVEITFKSVGEGVHAGQVVGSDCRDPFEESVALEPGEDLCEVTEVPGQSVLFRAVHQDGLEFEPVILRQRIGAGQDPLGDRPRGWWASVRRCGPAEGVEVSAHGSVSTGVSVSLDFLPEVHAFVQPSAHRSCR